MKCRNIRKNLSAHADGQLRPRLRQRVEKHIAVCERCADELSRLQEVSEAAKTSLRRIVSEKAPPSDLRELVMEAAQRTRQRRPVLMPVRRLAAAGAVIALASGIVVGIVQELRIRSEREVFRQRIAEESRQLALAKRDSEAARTQLVRAEGRLSKLEEELRQASARKEGATQARAGARSAAGRAWPPVLSSLQMPGVEGLLENGFF